ncbi:polycomb group protein EMBRYONIC FLOWER 2 isoform X4 [Nicotiana tabacum]|uniref:Polycomb group protein EMBRYONIC FLOWER 2 isoform X3 n=2 Tax=Nicotiana TaxID=4085 RepID=A0A1S4B6A6_TOBAC|nr:PREDICTED: polycomb group protein EMBRYONIC FLOWER 2-like isoform X3 [Nicotiana sylvestris]XP_016484377.1 PREDICTED: polycomb group protein EMBRYONIC FLOWER 2-like isoform X3 [Nicotiana tabacum]
MPGIPLVARETTHYTCYCSYSTVTDSMCRQDSATHLSAEEKIDAEESLSTYCKPVELYNILQRRAVRNPSFLQRCLQYKIQAKHKRRIEMAISVPATVNDESQIQNVFPLCVILARPLSNAAGAEAHFAVFQFRRACISTSFTGVDGINRAQAKFFLPEMDKLSAEVRAGSLAILFVSFAKLARDLLDTSSFPLNLEGNCLLGRMPMELLHLLWEKSPNLSLGERAEMLSTVDLSPCFMKTSCLDKDRHISLQYPRSSVPLATIHQLQVKISAEEAGAGERSAYDSFSYDDIPTTSLPRIIRLRTGNVVFNYRYYNNKLQRTEVTEDFTCPLCLVKCASFKGLRYHLCSSHDLFNFEFWVNEEYQAVNVSVRSDMWRSEVVVNGVDPKQQTFFFCRALLQKRQFFHSHRAQPMALEQVLSDRDSEDEVDDDVADLEDRRMLDDFVDVTKDEKQMMHLWNSFVRKQRVLADGHIPWACEAFSKLHGEEFARAPAFLWCWRLFMIKLWNHGLIDARGINNCNLILEQFQSQDNDSTRS